ncbi:MAG: hypothetical protein ACOX6T_14545 [Myxococcales bacterium]|jgi:hypothetical protein
MKNLLRVGLIFVFVLTAYGCGVEETDEPADAGVKADAGKKDSGTVCQTEMCNGECCQPGMVCDPVLQMCNYPSMCTPQCTGRYCGDPDTCGGRCTGCPGGQTCDTATWQCKPATCTPNCAGKTCGQSDGCGGKCTDCPSGQTCNQTTWQCQSGTCTPNCAGKTCGQDDGCGGKCVSCPSGQTCNQTSWQCEGGACAPNCNGKACGADDDCGDPCVGGCPGGQTCNQTTFVCEGGSSNCTMDSSLGSLTITDDAYYAFEDGSTEIGAIQVQTLLNEDEAPDALDITLYSGYGIFASGIAPGTYPLTGDELNYATCGICILGFSDIGEDGYATDLYFQTGGTVTISSVSGQFQATLSNVTFQSVIIDASTLESSPAGDGCTTSISSATVNSTMIETTE